MRPYEDIFLNYKDWLEFLTAQKKSSLWFFVTSELQRDSKIFPTFAALSIIVIKKVVESLWRKSDVFMDMLMRVRVRKQFFSLTRHNR